MINTTGFDQIYLSYTLRIQYCVTPSINAIFGASGEDICEGFKCLHSFKIHRRFILCNKLHAWSTFQFSYNYYYLKKHILRIRSEL